MTANGANAEALAFTASSTTTVALSASCAVNMQADPETERDRWIEVCGSLEIQTDCMVRVVCACGVCVCA